MRLQAGRRAARLLPQPQGTRGRTGARARSVKDRREQVLEEMGLGPVWRLRGRAPAQVEAPAAPRIPEPAKPAPPRAAPRRPAPVPGISGSVKIDLADDRAARIVKMEWPELKDAVKGCTACGLRKTCTQTVFGVGDERAEWLLVGEAPGAEEDAGGETFGWQGGGRLDKMVADDGRAQVDEYSHV